MEGGRACMRRREKLVWVFLQLSYLNFKYISTHLLHSALNFIIMYKYRIAVVVPIILQDFG